MNKRNLFTTGTAIGIYVSLSGLLLAVAPNVENLLTRDKSDDYKANVSDIVAIATGFIGAATTFIGRYNAGGTYTPKYFPGEDPQK